MPATTPKKPQTRRRFARLEARISPAQKSLFEKAAALEGRTLTDFVVSTVTQAARRVVQENEIVMLSERDQKVFLEALLHPPAPNKALRAAAKRHARMTSGKI